LRVKRRTVERFRAHSRSILGSPCIIAAFKWYECGQLKPYVIAVLGSEDSQKLEGRSVGPCLIMGA